MAGTVERVYDDEYLGTTVILRHEGGYETRYCNLTAMPTVKVGDSVKAGDVIGAVGDTAILEAEDKPHLHFQLRKDGKAIDPSDFLSA
jgi:murein DD-endopeptidase MepM/ murein hydrolase activator NlpD